MERTVWYLEFVKDGRWITPVINSECRTRDQADTLLSDRIANGQAFPGERVNSFIADDANDGIQR